jgi:hypothetical protein
MWGFRLPVKIRRKYVLVNTPLTYGNCGHVPTHLTFNNSEFRYQSGFLIDL